MKKLFLFMLLTIGLINNSYADRIDYGRYGDWDSYLLSKTNSKVCSARGMFEGGYKVIFNILKDNEGITSTRLNIEHPGWNMPSGFRKNVLIEIVDFSGSVIYSNYDLVFNDTAYTISQIPFIVNPELYSKILSGQTLIIYTNFKTLKFDISQVNVNHAIVDMVTCYKDHILNNRSNDIIKNRSKTNPF